MNKKIKWHSLSYFCDYKEVSMMVSSGYKEARWHLRGYTFTCGIDFEENGTSKNLREAKADAIAAVNRRFA